MAPCQHPLEVAYLHYYVQGTAVQVILRNVIEALRELYETDLIAILFIHQEAQGVSH